MRITPKLARRSDPRPGAYRPYVSGRRPGGRPSAAPKFRVLVHRQYLDAWNSLPDRVGMEAAQQFWDHVAFAPGGIPAVGTTSVMKGHHHDPKWPGYSKTIHYEISGAGRLDYQYNDSSSEGVDGDPHSVVKIITIDLSSH